MVKREGGGKGVAASWRWVEEEEALLATEGLKGRGGGAS